MKTSTIIGSLIFAGAAGLGLRYLLQTSNTGKKISASIHSIANPKRQGTTLILAVNVALDNPTNNSLSLKKPYLTLLYNGNEIGNSIPSEERITIKANDKTIINGINIQFPLSKLGLDAAKILITGKLPKLSIDIIMKTEANGIPYTATQHYDL